MNAPSSMNANVHTAIINNLISDFAISECGLTKKAEPPPTRGVNRDSGTASANGGWLRRLVRPLLEMLSALHKSTPESSKVWCLYSPNHPTLSHESHRPSSSRKPLARRHRAAANLRH